MFIDRSASLNRKPQKLHTQVIDAHPLPLRLL
jgi:hypothetical protein